MRVPLTDGMLVMTARAASRKGRCASLNNLPRKRVTSLCDALAIGAG
jgi:hypothetical protein